MKIGSILLTTLLALTGITVSNEASADRRPRPTLREVPHVPSKVPSRRLLRSVTATQLQAEAKADAAKLLGELRVGIRVTDVKALTDASTLLSSIAGLLGGNPAGIQLRFRKDGVAIVKLSRYASMVAATTPATPAPAGATPAPATKAPAATTPAPAATKTPAPAAPADGDDDDE